MTFGLVDHRKGLEFMIEAMQAVRLQHPEALYLIVGKTHPELVRREGEAYRKRLWQLVQDLGLEEHVAFVDEYLTQAQIVEYLLAADVYVTPYLDPKQVTSGTLAYALGAGKAVVSTRYPHAAEVLADQRGVLVDFRSAGQLAEATLRIIGDPLLKRTLEENAYAYGRETAWPRVGERMLGLLRSAALGDMDRRGPGAAAAKPFRSPGRLLTARRPSRPSIIPLPEPMAYGATARGLTGPPALEPLPGWQLGSKR